MKRLFVVGLGPGGRDGMTLEAKKALEQSEVICGYTAYADLIREDYPEKEYLVSGMTKEVERCHMALLAAQGGKTTAMICSGDAGVYGMAGLVLSLAEKHPEWKDSLGVVVFGNQSQQLQEQLPFHVYPLPYIKNEHEVVNIYNAVDLFAIPSLEENLPNMIMEAMACGVPCVGFNVGGIPEMIDHLHNGYVAQYKSSEDFANGIHWILTEPEYNELSAQACRKVLGNYSESIVAKKYTDVYNKITGKYA